MDSTTCNPYRYAYLEAEIVANAKVEAEEDVVPSTLRRLAYRPTVLAYFLECRNRWDADPSYAVRAKILHERATKLGKLWMEVRHESGPAHDAVRAALLEQITPMLRAVAVKTRKSTGTLASVDDLVQAAWPEIIEEMPKYDARISLFVTFATKIAARAMTREAMDLHCQVRIGTNANDKKAYFHGRRTMREIELTKGPLPAEELYALAAAELKIPVENMKRVMQAIGNKSFSFDEDRSEGGRVPSWPHDHKVLFDRRPLPEEAVAEQTDTARLMPAISKALNELTERDLGIITMRLMDPEGENASFEQIGKAFGYSKKHIREIVAKSLAKMRTTLEAMGVTAEDIKDFVPVPRGRRPVVNLELLDKDYLAS